MGQNSGYIKLDETDVGQIISGAQNQIDCLEKEKELIQDIADEAVKDGDGIGAAIYGAEIRQIDRIIKVLKIIDHAV